MSSLIPRAGRSYPALFRAPSDRLPRGDHGAGPGRYGTPAPLLSPPPAPPRPPRHLCGAPRAAASCRYAARRDVSPRSPCRRPLWLRRAFESFRSVRRPSSGLTWCLSLSVRGRLRLNSREVARDQQAGTAQLGLGKSYHGKKSP